MKTGYIGLGNMGGALARRLLLSQELTVFDLDPAAIETCVAAGGTAANGVRAIAEGETIQLTGGGKQERDYTYVDDVARGTVAALRPLGYEVINLGNDSPVTVGDTIRMIEDCLEKKAIVEHVPMHPADVQATWADVGRAGQLLDWRPEVSVEEGIRRCVDWYRDNREWAKEIR